LFSKKLFNVHLLMLEIMQQPQKLLHASIYILIQRWWYPFGLKHEALDQLQAFSTNKATFIALFVYNYQLPLLKMTSKLVVIKKGEQTM
jgi:hypothetical protein